MSLVQIHFLSVLLFSDNVTLTFGSFFIPRHVHSLLCTFLICRYEDAFNRVIDEINSTAAYEWWEGSVHSILLVLANPCAWSWKQWRRRRKIHRLQEYVKSKYDHSCLRSCRSRALYKGMKVRIRII